MKIKKLKLTKTVLRNLTSEDQINLHGGYDNSDHFCTGGCTPGGFTCLAQTCGCTDYTCPKETELC